MERIERGRDGLRAGPSERSGFSLLELSIAIVVLVIALGSLSGTVVSTTHLTRTNEQLALADEAARGMAATLQVTQFSSIFATYNGNPLDDPGGPGTAPGPNFDVRGLNLRNGDPDGMVGRIEFPTVLVGGGPVEQLREDVENAALGMPRDLDGDGLDLLDHAPDDYIVLPVSILIEWVGAGGNAVLRLDLVLTE